MAKLEENGKKVSDANIEIRKMYTRFIPQSLHLADCNEQPVHFYTVRALLPLSNINFSDAVTINSFDGQLKTKHTRPNGSTYMPQI